MKAEESKINVLEVVYDQRMEHGLRHNDYQRYRRFCSRKIAKLKSIKKTHLVSLFECERAWAYSCELKQEKVSLDQQLEGAGARKRIHSIKKLKRAFQHAQTFLNQFNYDASAPDEDDDEYLQVQGYVTLINAHLHFEYQSWNDALTNYLLARTFYEKCSQLPLASHKLVTLCHAAMDEIDPNIRYCGYGLGKATDLQDLLELSASHPTLGSQFKSLLKSTLEKETESFVWMNGYMHQDNMMDVELLVEVTNNEILGLLIQSQKYRSELDQLPKPQTYLGTESKTLQVQNRLQVFDKLLAVLYEAEQLAVKDSIENKNAITKATSSKSNARTLGLEKVLGLCIVRKVLATLERQDFLILVNSSSKTDDVKPVVKEDNIKIVLTSRKFVDELSRIEIQSNQELKTILETVSKSLALLYDANIKYEFAKYYHAQGKVSECMTLVQKAFSDLQESESLCNGTLLDMNQRQKVLKSRVVSLKAKTIASFALDSSKRSKEADELTNQVTQLNISPTSPTHPPQLQIEPALFESLGTLTPLPQSKTPVLVNDPQIKAVPFRPLFYDLAYNAPGLELPLSNLERLVKGQDPISRVDQVVQDEGHVEMQSQTQSTASGVLGALFGWK